MKKKQFNSLYLPSHNYNKICSTLHSRATNTPKLSGAPEPPAARGLRPSAKATTYNFFLRRTLSCEYSTMSNSSKCQHMGQT